jgi:hypothetical protein
MKTTTQITQEHKAFLTSVNEMPMNKYLEKANVKWYSEDEIKKVIAKCYSYGHAEPLTDYYNEKDDNLICVAQLLELLFNAPDLNSRSSNEDSLNNKY